MDRYLENYVSFHDSMEAKLLQKILESIDSEDLELFQQTIVEYDRLRHFDDLQTSLLLFIKKNILTDADDLL
jgi:hypothetical protein